jgi:hypothetical protein
VRIPNCDDSAHRLRAGEVTGTAKPAMVAVEGQPQLRPCFSARGSDFTESVPREDRDYLTPLVHEHERDVGHVSCLTDSLPSDLTLEQRQQAADFVRMNSSSFFDV